MLFFSKPILSIINFTVRQYFPVSGRLTEIWLNVLQHAFPNGRDKKQFFISYNIFCRYRNYLI